MATSADVTRVLDQFRAGGVPQETLYAQLLSFGYSHDLAMHVVVSEGGSAAAALDQTGGGLSIMPAEVFVGNAAALEPLLPMEAGLGAGPQAGDDLRDVGGGLAQVGVIGSLPAVARVMGLTAVLSMLPRLVRGPVAAFFRTFGRGVAVQWQRLPDWMKAVLPLFGVAVGTDIIVDALTPGGGPDVVPGLDLVPGRNPAMFPGGVGIVGSWEANGVRFYRLSDGRLAVQNKRGRWKVWRPKKPIVLMPAGAGDLRTLLRADAVLNRQSKRIAKMLSRRAPRKPRSRVGGTVVLSQDGTKIARLE